MKKNEFIYLFCLSIFAGLVLPESLLASETSAYGGKEIAQIGNNIRNFLFEIGVPYVGGIFGAVHTIKSFISNNFQAMGAFALLTASSLIIPHFLKGVFGSALLLP